MLIEMELSRVVIRENCQEQLIVLKEKYGEKSMPIVIGIPEALSIDRRLKGVIPPRPMTHDLMFNILEELNVPLERIVIHDMQNQTFYASLILEKNGKKFEVDSRPSDAIALGIVNDTPIFVSEDILNAIGQ